MLAFDDVQIEAVHDFIQWLFPLPEASRAVSGAPVLAAAEAAAIRADPAARAGLAASLARMTRFYETANAWLVPYDHNHLRITRILSAVNNLLGREEAAAFHKLILARNDTAGGPINRNSLGYWAQALS